MDLLLAMSNFQAGAYVFIMGFIVVFLGMGVIIAVVSLIGKLMSSLNKKKAKKNVETIATIEEVEQNDDEEDARVRAAIVAVLTNYYFDNGGNCEFKIKKIRKL